jgi:hypothetical protein
MKRTSLVIACALAAGVPAVATAAGDPLAQAKADLAELTADVSAAASTVAADAKAGSLAQLKRDAKTGHITLKADWKLLLTDAAAARKTGGDRTELRSLLKAARTQMKGFRSAVRTAYTQAAKQNKGSNSSKSSPGSSQQGSKGKHSGQGSDDDGSGG